ncbi:ExbD/TolR family protein [Lentisalinibacter orientalis]|jgi:biopolymer transport protein ExbD|uniref:ExbD/TolR family protein n=1 Tax=Lentisalinibacter orientalis TaxID=2992241 RepID=UPI0038692E8B
MMRNTRRLKRMTRNRTKVTKMNLTSLMDVFTILVFFLLVNSGSVEVMEAPKQVTLPESMVEEKPRETVVIFVSPDEVLVQGRSVIRVSEILESETATIEAITARLEEISQRVVGPKTRSVAKSQEVTILADKSVPFTVIKRIMTTCTGEGYGQVSLAVVQKPADTAAT